MIKFTFIFAAYLACALASRHRLWPSKVYPADPAGVAYAHAPFYAANARSHYHVHPHFDGPVPFGYAGPYPTGYVDRARYGGRYYRAVPYDDAPYVGPYAGSYATSYAGSFSTPNGVVSSASSGSTHDGANNSYAYGSPVVA